MLKKKVFAFTMALALTAGMCACGAGTADQTSAAASSAAASTVAAASSAETAAQPDCYSSTEDVTLEKLLAQLTPSAIVEREGIFSMTSTYTGSGEDLLEGSEQCNTYAKRGDILEVCEKTAYSDGYTTNIFYSSDPDDMNYYIASTGGNDVSPMEGGEVDAVFGTPLAGFDTENVTLTSVAEQDGCYVATLETTVDGSTEKDVITLDPKTGRILKLVSSYPSVKGSGDMEVTTEFSYGDAVAMDYSAKTDNGGAAPAAEVSSESGQLHFNTTDINGTPVTDEILREARLVLVNYWEPWCGPCVAEMPDLQKLYENYKDKGLLVLGVYSEEENAQDIVKDTGVTYPVVRCDDQLAQYTQTYFPYTLFTDGNGSILPDESYGGSRSYEEWEEIVNKLLSED